jgi:hypothetical protein
VTEPNEDDRIDRTLAALVAAAGADAPAAPDASVFRSAQPAHVRRLRPRGVTIAAIVAAAASVVGLVLVARWPESQPGSPTTVAMSSTTSTTRAPTTSVAPVVYAPGWNRLPDPPLAPRTGAVSATVGDEVFVIGGGEYVCAPGDNCAMNGRTFADGAAFDATTGTWRTIADAPDAILSVDSAVLGTDIFVMAWRSPDGQGRRLFRYDTTADEWHEIDVPDGVGSGLEADGDRLIAWAIADVDFEADFDAESDPSARLDRAYSPITGQWALMPGHKSQDHESRVLCGTELGLVAVLRDDGPARNEGSTPAGTDASSLVTIELLAPGATDWETLSAPSPRGWGTVLCLGAQVVVGPRGVSEPLGGVFDLTSRSWSELPPSAGDARSSGFAGVVGDSGTAYSSGIGGQMLDLRTSEWSTVPPLDDRTTAAITTVGDRLFVMGGQDWAAFDDGGPHGDAWLWVPPTSS